MESLFPGLFLSSIETCLFSPFYVRVGNISPLFALPLPLEVDGLLDAPLTPLPFHALEALPPLPLRKKARPFRPLSLSERNELSFSVGKGPFSREIKAFPPWCFPSRLYTFFLFRAEESSEEQPLPPRRDQEEWSSSSPVL